MTTIKSVPTTLRALLVASALLASAVAIGTPHLLTPDATAQSALTPPVLPEKDGSGGKLNYYRVEGGDPYCKDKCDGHRCCRY